MKVLIRVDAGDNIGLGHFYRTLGLAMTLKSNGHDVSFVHEKSDFWINMQLEDFGPQKYPLSEGAEEDQMFELIKKERFDIFYVDGIINFRESFISQVRQYSIIVFYQNLSKSRHLCDIFILPSMHQNIDFFREFSSETKVYQGLQYFLFHPIIRSFQPKKKISAKIQKIAISTGGSDPTNSLLKLFKWIDYTLFPNINFDFFYGASYQHINKIPKLHPSSVKFKPFDHKNIMISDFLISAFGVSTYEFLYLGMPIISFGHQKSNAIASDFLSEKLKVIWSLGELKNPETLNAMIGKFINNYYTRIQLVKNAEKILDLEGPNRIVQILEKSK